jgi:hypothetical protein
MIKVIVGTTTQRNEKNYSAGTSIRTILEDNAVDYSVAQIMLDGASLKPGDMDRTLADLNITEKCMLIAVVKASNAR